MSEAREAVNAPDLASDLRCALDPAMFASERLGMALDPWQQRTLSTPAPQVCLANGRQVGKSTIAAILAAHCAVYQPGSLSVVVAPSQRQSVELLRKVQEVLGRLQPRPAIVAETAMTLRMANRARVVALPGDSTTIRGLSAVSLAVIDEAAFVDEALFAAIRPMLATSAGRLIVLSTPRGRVGTFWSIWSTGGADWHRERVPSSECPRIAPLFLERERREIGDWTFRQEYLAEFVDADAQLFSSAVISAAISHDVRPLQLRL